MHGSTAGRLSWSSGCLRAFRRLYTTRAFAHVTEPIDRYLLEDALNLRQFLDTELRYGLGKAFDTHVVTEITTAATRGDLAGVTMLGIREAITVLQQADIEPTGIVLTPADWQGVEEEATTQRPPNTC